MNVNAAVVLVLVSKMVILFTSTIQTVIMYPI